MYNYRFTFSSTELNHENYQNMFSASFISHEMKPNSKMLQRYFGDNTNLQCETSYIANSYCIVLCNKTWGLQDT